MQAKRTSVNLDPQIVADAKIALWEAQRFGRAPDERAYLETLRGLVR